MGQVFYLAEDKVSAFLVANDDAHGGLCMVELVLLHDGKPLAAIRADDLCGLALRLTQSPLGGLEHFHLRQCSKSHPVPCETAEPRTTPTRRILLVALAAVLLPVGGGR